MEEGVEQEEEEEEEQQQEGVGVGLQTGFPPPLSRRADRRACPGCRMKTSVSNGGVRVVGRCTVILV